MKYDLKPIYSSQNWESEVELVPDCPTPNTVWEWIEQGQIVLWLHSGIFTGTIEGKEIHWHLPHPDTELEWSKHLVELRAFNEDREYRLWRSKGKIKGRTRVDQPSEEGTTAFDIPQQLRGVVAQPFQQALKTGAETIFLQSRHYLDLNGAGMASYSDVRFVKLNLQNP